MSASAGSRPRVEISQTSRPKVGEWSVAGLTRSQADLVSLSNGVPAYGGTPSDASVIALIGHLKARGLSVTLYPVHHDGNIPRRGKPLLFPEPLYRCKRATGPIPWLRAHHL